MENAKTTARRAGASALPKKLAGYAVCGLLGFCLSGVRFEQTVAPFAAAYTAGASAEGLLPAAVGSAVGALLFSEPLTALKYVGAVMLIVLLRLAYDRFFQPGREMWVCPVFAFVSLAVCGGVILLVTDTDAAGVVALVCEALIAGAGACFARRVFALFPAGARTFVGSAGDTAAVLICGSVLLLSFDQFRIQGFSPAHVLAFAAVLFLSFAAGAAAGGAAGISAGLMLGFSPENGYLAFFLPSAGLMCSVVSSYGRLPAAGVFAVLGAMFLVLKGTAENALTAALEILLAALLFALTPKRAVNAAVNAVRPLSAGRGAFETRALVRLRLRRSAKAVRDIAESVQAVCRMLTSPAPPAADLTEEVRASVCAACTKKAFCWGGFQETTRRGFASLGGSLREKGSLLPEDAPAALQTVCRDVPGLLTAFERAYCEQNARLCAQNEIFDVKTMAAAQFGSVAAVLEDAARETASLGEPEPYIAALARDVFTACGFVFSTLCVSEDENGRLLLEVYCTEVPRLTDYNALLQKLHAKTNVRFMPPVQDEYKKEGVVLSFCEKTALRAQFYKRSAAAAGENLCGDTVEAFADGRGGFFCVLSDGMGTGKTAAIDSVMTCSLFSRLMRAGFQPEVALQAVNCALMVKSEDESLATLDMVRVDLYTGRAAFFKAGGSFSVVRRAGRTAVVEQSSLPLGIMRETKFEHSEIDLAAGDAVLLLSDGANVVPKEFFKDLFYRRRDADARELTELVLAEAVRRSPIGRADDITAACILLHENKGPY